jgi:hypothetical protein
VQIGSGIQERNCWLAQEEHLVFRLGLLLDDHGAADGHNEDNHVDGRCSCS